MAESIKKFAKKINGIQFDCWGDPNPDGSTHWMLATNTDGLVDVLGEVDIAVSRHTRVDFSGEKRWRIVTKSECRLTVRLGWKQAFEFPTAITYSLGEKAALGEICAALSSDRFPHWIANEITYAIYATGVEANDDRVFFAHYSTDDGHPLRPAQRLLKLYKEVAGLE